MAVNFSAPLRQCDEFTDAMAEAADDEADETAVAIAERYRADARRNTGSMAESVFVITPRQDTYAEAVARAHELNSRVTILTKPRFDRGPGRAFVGVAAAHAYWSEYGGPTIDADPVLGRAVATERPRRAGRFRKTLQKAKARRRL